MWHRKSRKYIPITKLYTIYCVRTHAGNLRKQLCDIKWRQIYYRRVQHSAIYQMYLVWYHGKLLPRSSRPDIIYFKPTCTLIHSARSGDTKNRGLIRPSRACSVITLKPIIEPMVAWWQLDTQGHFSLIRHCLIKVDSHYKPQVVAMQYWICDLLEFECFYSWWLHCMIQGVIVTKPIFSVPLFSEFFSIFKTHVRYWISPLYFTDDAAIQLRWNFCKIAHFAYEEIKERSVTRTKDYVGIMCRYLCIIALAPSFPQMTCTNDMVVMAKTTTHIKHY